MVIEVSYGLDFLPQTDPFIGSAEKALAASTLSAMPSEFLVNTANIKI